MIITEWSNHVVLNTEGNAGLPAYWGGELNVMGTSENAAGVAYGPSEPHGPIDGLRIEMQISRADDGSVVDTQSALLNYIPNDGLYDGGQIAFYDLEPGTQYHVRARLRNDEV